MYVLWGIVGAFGAIGGRFANWLLARVSSSPVPVTRAGSTPVLHPLNLLYLKVRFIFHNVIDAIVHVDALFHSDKLELLSYFVFEDNGESHFAKSIRSCSIWCNLSTFQLRFSV